LTAVTAALVSATAVRRRWRCWCAVAALLLTSHAGCAPGVHREVAPVAPPPAQLQEFVATAYSLEGPTATGAPTRRGICAADPQVLPLGSRIRVHDAGAYSGEYVVADTGRAVHGRKIDLYVASAAAAKRFGRKQVRVELLGAKP
jgi:3D (Asp-Asp-Asp) domain-containing protein